MIFKKAASEPERTEADRVLDQRALTLDIAQVNTQLETQCIAVLIETLQATYKDMDGNEAPIIDGKHREHLVKSITNRCLNMGCSLVVE